MKKLIYTISILSFFFSFVKIEKVNAQLTGVKNIPGNYATLAIAISDLNNNGVGAGGVTLNLLSGNPQTAPVGGYRISAIGNIANTITIKGNGNTITASGTQPIGSIKDAVFMIKGGDYITIESFVLRENPSNTINNNGGVNNMTEWGVALLRASPTNGSQSNTIKNCTISLNKNYTNTFGIYSNTSHDTIDAQNSTNITSVSGANNNNKIYTNLISNVGRPICFVGSNNPAYMDTGNDIGGSDASKANSITDWTTAPANSYVLVPSGSIGISIFNETGTNVSFNSLSASINTSNLRGLFQGFNPSPIGSFSNVISSNTISLNANATDLGGYFNAIYSYGGVSTMNLSIINNLVLNCSFSGNPWNISYIENYSPTKTLNINNNVFQGNVSIAAGFICSGIVNGEPATDSININNNQIGNNSGGVISFSGGSFNGISNVSSTSSAAAISISNNNFQGINYSATSTATCRFISNQATNCGSVNINSNTFTNLSINTTGDINFIENYAQRIAGTSCIVNNNSIVTAFNKIGAGGTVFVYSGQNSSPVNTTETNSYNNFSNITLNGGNSSLILWQNNDACGKVISNNTFNNISGAGTGGVRVIDSYGSDSLNQVNIFRNIISNISANGSILGIRSLGNSLNIFTNKIYNLQSNHTNGFVYGISLTSGKINAFNNFIGDLKAPLANRSSEAIIGINVNGASANIYYNTICLNASSTGTNFSTSGIYHTASSIPTSQTLNLINNILVNTSTPNGTGKTVAFKRSGNVLNNYISSSNNNLFYAGIPSSSKLIFYDGTNSDQTISSYKTRVAPRDSNSFSENPNFLSVSGSNVNFLHIDSTLATQIESGGINITGISDDYDGNIRNASAPDVGADEFKGTCTLNLTALIEGFYDNNSNLLISDTLRVYLRNYLSPYVIVDSAKGYLNSSGTGTFNFSKAVNGVNYYLQLKHRNSIETWSDSAKSFVNSNLNIDFTPSVSKAFGNNMIQVDISPVKYAVYNGDINQDAIIDLSDVLLVYNDASIFNTGYINTDVNGDNITDLSDVLITYNNSSNFVGVIRP